MKKRILLLALAIVGVTITACVKDEIFQGPPVISDLTLTPQAPTETDNVTVNIKVTDMNGVKSVTLYYKVNDGSFTTVSMVEAATANFYTGQIPSQASDATVYYYVEAENVSGKKSYHPATAPTTTAAYTVGAPSIVMNEIYSRGTVEDPDWIEIYNNSDVTVDISGYKIYDSGGQSGGKDKKVIPSGTILGPRGFYVVVVDDGSASGFGLSSGGEDVWFESPTGTIVDNVAFPAMPDPTTSYGRIPDGSNTWQILSTITKGAANDDTPPPPTPVVKLNEIYSRGSVENPDWVELYNTSAAEVNIGGFKIYDSGGQSGSKPKMEFATGTTIPANGFIVIVVDDAATANPTGSSFGLSSGGEELWLEDASGNVIDNVTFPALEEEQSYGRYPDGDSNWQILEIVTRGAANNNNPAPTIRMNEIYSRGTTANPDWIELYNTSASEVNIGGFKIYDSGGQSGSKPKMEFAAGTTIPANGFIVIVVDDAATANPTGSSFGLGSGGEEVWLEDASGNIIDNVTFPALEVTQSYGRFADGTSNWQVLNVVTPNAANDNSTPSPITINEIFSRGTSEDPDWIELYNSSSSEVDISGYKIYDNGGQSGSKPKMEFPSGTTIAAKGFVVIVVDDAATANPTGSSFGLGSGGETVWLEDASGNVINTVAFPALEATQTYGRIPDGTYNWQVLNTITKGAANSQ